MGWGDGAWGEDRWGGDQITHVLRASGVGGGGDRDRAWSDDGWGDGEWSGDAIARLTVDKAATATGEATGSGTAALQKTVALVARGIGRGIGRASIAAIWTLGSDLEIEPLQDISFDAETISLSFVADADQIDQVRGLETTGDFAVESGAGGRFRAIDRSGGSAGAVALEPSPTETPAVDPTDVYIADVSETPLSGANEAYEVSIELQRTTNRSERYTAIDESGEAPNEISLSHGTIALEDTHIGLIERSGSTTGTRPALDLLLSTEQAAAIADSIGFPAGVVDRTVLDGSDLVEDSSGNHELAISTNSTIDLDDGTYVARDWSISTYSNTDDSARWRASITLSEA